MADTDAVNGNQQLPTDEEVTYDEEAEKREEEEKKKNREPPIIYKDLLDVSILSFNNCSLYYSYAFANRLKSNLTHWLD